MERFGIQFAGNFSGRYRRQQQLLTSLRSSEIKKYYWTRGDYSDMDGSDRYTGITLFYKKPDYDVTAINTPQRKDSEELIGMEQHLAQRISLLMELKTDDNPVICIDLGSMHGISWARLAKHFEPEVREGKVAFVTTSLSESPSPRTSRNQNNFGAISKSEAELLRYTQREHLVHKIIGDAVDLKRQHIIINGRDVSLRSNVDILYESLSLTAWSKTPDLDILHIEKLLSHYGTYYVKTLDTIDVQQGSSLEEIEQRLEAITLAHIQLQNIYGLQMITEGEEGKYTGVRLTYHVFKRPNAPKIRADN
jgi:hypothetical protein